MNIGEKVAFHSLGCKVNSYETDAMQQLLIENGYQIVPFDSEADIYIINTCTVTNVADRKSRQMIHRAKKMNPNAVVVAVGCYSQIAADKLKDDECVDIIIGNNKKHEIVQILKKYTGDSKYIAHFDINHEKTEYEVLNISNTAEHTRAYIKIQDGCNQFCSYCLIPYARGRVRSRKPKEVLEEVVRLVGNGYREIVLTGIHVSSYGTDFNGEVDLDSDDNILLSLLKSINNIEGLSRIRLSSLEPRIMTEEFVREISKLDKICPHFHLSLQSGSQATLKRMNRHYSPADYKKSCDLLKEYYIHPALTTDVIVGFPGETDAEFLESRTFIEEINFYETHIFKYSKRVGTRAAQMDNQVDENIKTNRSSELIDLNKKNKKTFMEYYIGKNMEILIEEQLKFDDSIYMVGHTKEYVKAAVKSDRNLSGRFIEGRVVSFLNDDVLLIE